jgi:hypothetical protein
MNLCLNNFPVGDQLDYTRSFRREIGPSTIAGHFITTIQTHKRETRFLKIIGRSPAHSLGCGSQIEIGQYIARQIVLFHMEQTFRPSLCSKSNYPFLNHA